MIFGIDHIALTCSDAQSACAHVTSLGYGQSFSELGLANPLIKKPFMKNWSDRHDLIYFRKNGTFNIEVIRYDTVHEGPSYVKAPKSFGESIVLLAKDLEVGYHFWSLFGLKLVNKDPDHYWCSFRTPFSQETSFVISRELSESREYELDTKGFNCIAFTSTSVWQDRKLMHDAGIKTTEIEDVQVNGKDLSIFFAEGNSGEKVEIIGVKGKANL